MGGDTDISDNDIESLEFSNPDDIPFAMSEEGNRDKCTESDLEEEYTAVPPASFSFILNSAEWLKIKPDESPLVRRHLARQWTNIFSERIERFIPSCVLRFTYNRVARKDTRKKNAAFFYGKAKCTFDKCLSLVFTIQKEPTDIDLTVDVNVDITGDVSHPRNERHKRHLSGDRREEYKAEASKIGSSNLHYQKLGEMSEAAYSAGNPGILEGSAS